MGKSRTVCPRCDSDDVIGDGVEWLDADEVRIGGLCNDCGATWTIVMHPDVMHAVNGDPIRGEGMIIDNNGANPNSNCLEGKSCPSCGGFGPFRIDIQGRVTLMDDGYDWSGAEVEEPAMGGTWGCFHCGHEADADAFEEAHRFCVQGLCGSPAKHEDGSGRRLCRAHYLEALWDRFAASMGEGDANVAYEAAWQALKSEMAGGAVPAAQKNPESARRDARMPSILFSDDTDYAALTSLLWLANGKSSAPGGIVWEFSMADGSSVVGEFVSEVADSDDIDVRVVRGDVDRLVRLHLDEVVSVIYL